VYIILVKLPAKSKQYRHRQLRLPHLYGWNTKLYLWVKEMQL